MHFIKVGAAAILFLTLTSTGHLLTPEAKTTNTQAQARAQRNAATGARPGQSSAGRAAAAAAAPSRTRNLTLVPHRITLANGKTFALNLPEAYEIRVAAEGLERVRFMARSPDNRIFVTDMHNLTDNRRGIVYILDGFDERSGKFSKVTPYLTRLRNPNSVAFHTDDTGTTWLYLALTDRLVRYRYTAGETAPTSEPEVLATFPDYGLSYKYGGWHLTRTVVAGPNGKIYVTVGSSCNACEEKEEVRATILEMEANGRRPRTYARGLRNAVGIRWVGARLYVTNMGADHLGADRPADTMYTVSEGANYGWPYCYQYRSSIYADKEFNASANARAINCKSMPRAYATFAAHSSPLGLEYFERGFSEAGLQDSFLVALHGSSDPKLQRGYKVVRVSRRGTVQDFITGFLQEGKVLGRPADVLRMGADGLLLTDDHAGVVYYIFKKRATGGD